MKAKLKSVTRVIKPHAYRLKESLVFSCGMMKLRLIVTSRVYQQLFILILLLQNSVSGQIDWAEDDDDPGKNSSTLTQSIYFVVASERI